jgi:hypothetical protein
MSVAHNTSMKCWCDPTGYRPEVLFGRMLAACVHPYVAWQRLSTSWRALMLTVYAATAYVTVLAALWL